MADNIQRDLGSLEARVGVIEKDINEIKMAVGQVRDTIMQTKGGWKVIVAVAGIAGTMGALSSKVLAAIGISAGPPPH